MRKQLKCLFKGGYFTYLNQISTFTTTSSLLSLQLTLIRTQDIQGKYNK